MSTFRPEHIEDPGALASQGNALAFAGPQRNAQDSCDRKLKICLVRPELLGPGTAGGAVPESSEPAYKLAAAGHDITVLQLSSTPFEPSLLADKSKEFARNGIHFISLPPLKAEKFLCSTETALSWQAHQWLKERDFDLIHCPEHLGLPFYSLIAKLQGLAYQNTLWCVEIKAPLAIARQAGNRHLDRVTDMILDFLERRSAEMADVVFARNGENLNWAKQNGWRLKSSPLLHSMLIEEPTAATLTQAWQAWQQSQIATGAGIESAGQPLVSICLVHHNRPRLLKQALASIAAQDYPNLEVVLVDDGSDQPDALAFITELEPQFAARGWQIVRQENLYLGAARNNAARHARGTYILFMDDDNYAKPHEVSTFVRVAERTGAEILTCQLDVFDGDDPPSNERAPSAVRLSLGNALTVGIARNCFGDANALFRRDSFFKLGGFSEDFGITHEDWELFARAAFKGMHIETIPESLFWYRVGPDSMINSTVTYANYMRSLRPYLEGMPEHLAELARFTLGLHLSVEELLGANATANHHLNIARKSADTHLDLLRANVFARWQSLSLRLTSPGRRVFRLLNGLGPEPVPQAETVEKALAELDDMENSLSWTLTGPCRAVLIAKNRLLEFCGLRKRKRESGHSLGLINMSTISGIVMSRTEMARSIVEKRSGGSIPGGPFKGMKYVEESIGSAFYPKLMGTYELELHELTERLCDEQFEVILNIGAGEGYYAVGMALRCPQAKIVAAEEDEGRRRDLLVELARKNGVSDRITLLGRCDIELLSWLLDEHSGKRILIIMDVEGYEVKLLDPTLIPQLKQCTILVEVHDGRSTGPIGDELARRFYSTHDITRTWFKDRTIADLPVRRPLLNRHLVMHMDEHRKYGLCWQHMRPRGD